jgi:hypothetical protein
MSARDRKRGNDGGGQRSKARSGAPTRRAAGRSPWLWAAAVLAVISLAGWFLLRSRVVARAPDSGATAGPAATLTPQVAYQTGLRMAQAGYHMESLPYFRRALEGKPLTAWVVHLNYAGALYNVGLEVRDRHGVAVPATRSSIERVAMMREALAELDIAERLATNPHDRAIAIRSRAERLQIWGFPWDAFAQLRQAQWTDTLWRELGRFADGYMVVLEHPERPRPVGKPADRTGR